jgi:exopolysaccharide biosynthesis operon protein EpsL
VQSILRTSSVLAQSLRRRCAPRCTSGRHLVSNVLRTSNAWLSTAEHGLRAGNVLTKSTLVEASGYALMLVLVLLQLEAEASTVATESKTLEARAFSTLNYDSNLFRLSDSVSPSGALGSTARSDFISTVGVGLALDYALSRQRLVAQVRVNDQRYEHYGFLDHQSYNGEAAIKWQLGNDWSGDLGYSRYRALAGFGDFRLPVKNLVTTARPYLLAKYQLGAALALTAQDAEQTYTNSAAVSRAADHEEQSYEAGAEFVPATGNTVGLGVRHVDGKFRNRPTDGFAQEDYLATFSTHLTGKSLLSGYVGYTQRKHEQDAQSDFSGPSGRAALRWAALPKTTVSVIAQREILPYADISSSYALTNAVSVQADWVATDKIAVALRGEHRNRRFIANTSVNAPFLPERKDNTEALSVSVTYRMLKSLQFIARIGHERNTSNRATLDYRATTASIGAQFSFEHAARDARDPFPHGATSRCKVRVVVRVRIARGWTVRARPHVLRRRPFRLALG